MMLCHSKLPNKRVQHWENQNHFLQLRHGHKKAVTPEIILVGLRHDEDGFEILSWTISVAARPGDKVIVFHLNCDGTKVENLNSKLQIESSEPHDSALTQIKILKDLCQVKQVKLDVKFSVGANEELELVGEASSILATMLVRSPSNRHELRNIQKVGLSLARRVRVGCSIVFVKDYKVIFYEENICNNPIDSSTMYMEGIDAKGPNLRAPMARSKSLHQPLGSIQMQISNLSWLLEGDVYNVDASNATNNQIWPVHSGEGSPRSDHDCPYGLSSELDASTSSSSDSTLPHSLSRKGLLFCVSSHHDGDEVSSKDRSQNSTSSKKGGLIMRTLTFPPSGCLKKLPGTMDCTLMRSSLKSYLSTLWSTESMSHDPFTPASDMHPNCRYFSYEELSMATNAFNPENMVGRGGHSDVYKGTLVDGRAVAIKRMTRGLSEEMREKGFLTELGIICHVSHPNTVQLVGFSVEGGLHLIFNFLTNGSVATLLHGLNAPLLDWCARYRIAVGTARGLHYLHSACPRRVIHRDIKASNILLGPNFEPQIADFGLAKWLPKQWGRLRVFPVEGTFGYLAPEYFMHGIVHEKIDVFAFGVLLLELISGQLPINKCQQSLVIWAKPLLESWNIDKLVDPRLDGQYDLQEMQTMVKAAAMCVQSSPASRPYMAQVLEMLTGESCDSHSIHSSESDRYQDSSDEYSSSSHYLSDMSRHRAVALEF